MTPTIDRLVLRMFLPRVAALFVAFLVIAALFELAERGRLFQTHATPFVTRAVLVMYRMPALMVQLCPLVFVFATVWTTAALARHGETAAFRALGIPLTRPLVPMIVVAALGSGVLYAAGETWVPASSMAVDRTIHVAIQGVDPKRYALSEYVWLRDGNWFVYVREVDDGGRLHRGAVLFEMDSASGLPTRRIDAELLVNDGVGGWRVKRGRERTFRPGGNSFRMITDEAVPLTIETANFAGRRFPAEELSFAMIARERDRRLGEGRDARPLELAFWAKTVFPWTLPLVVWLVGAATLRWNRRGHITMALAIGVGVIVPYLVLWNLGLGLGKNGVVVPLLATTAPHLIPIVVATVATLRLRLSD